MKIYQENIGDSSKHHRRHSRSAKVVFGEGRCVSKEFLQVVALGRRLHRPWVACESHLRLDIELIQLLSHPLLQFRFGKKDTIQAGRYLKKKLIRLFLFQQMFSFQFTSILLLFLRLSMTNTQFINKIRL